MSPTDFAAGDTAAAPVGYGTPAASSGLAGHTVPADYAAANQSGYKARFHTIIGASEYLEAYRPGGYHPVHLDEVFNNRYRVIRKLGCGFFSSVWLAVDATKQQGYVALKIMRADASKSCLPETAFLLSGRPKKLKMPLGLRAPELILKEPFDQAIDIWSLACVTFNFLTGTRLFCVDGEGRPGDEPDTDDGHLLSMTDILGDLPESLFRKWARTHFYFGPKRKLMNSMVGRSWRWRNRAPGVLEVYKEKTLEDMFHEHRPAHMSEDDEHLCTAFLRDMLQYDPSKRASASELLQHPWLAEDDPE
ncbi:MAG: hypothetical protein M1826_001951 [Phylliscum demangeonii]|nr:MAG: hypothetical protein M1826_001951 [Phylliscum demangeonii]